MLARGLRSARLHVCVCVDMICILVWYMVMIYVVYAFVHSLGHNLFFSIPYSGKFLMEKTFANFADFGSAMKVFSVKFWGCGTHGRGMARTHFMISLDSPEKINLQGTFRPPWGRGHESSTLYQ